MPVTPTLLRRRIQLTDTQARVIYELMREAGLSVHETFHPLEFYPDSTKEHHECRRALNELTTLGLVALVPCSPCRMAVIGRDGYTYRLRMTRDAAQAYDLWACRDNERGEA